MAADGVIVAPAEGGHSEVGPAVEKERRLVDWLRAHGPLLVGYSGGVDSAYLAAVARGALGREGMGAALGVSASLSAAQRAQAHAVAARCDFVVEEVATDELQDPEYAANPANRCYFCKTALWARLVPLARERGLRSVVDGTNADDLSDHRPGRAATSEFAVLSPLALLGFTKAEIRERSRRLDLPTWSVPSMPCLASRIPNGVAVTQERLALVERAEDALRAIGVVGDLRVRYRGTTASVELSAAERERWSAGETLRRLEGAVREAGFTEVLIDPRGYRQGSLNEPLLVSLGRRTA